MAARDTFTKKSATEMTHKGEMQGPDGKWMAGDEETCKRAVDGEEVAPGREVRPRRRRSP